jgi:putative endonuclease
MSTTGVGRRGEAAARRALEQKGYVPLAQNFRDGPREIDLVMQDGETVVFVEVKARSSVAYGTPGEFVTKSKQRLLTLAAQRYLMQNDLLDRPARFDVVEIYIRDKKLRHIPNAFFAAE